MNIEEMDNLERESWRAQARELLADEYDEMEFDVVITRTEHPGKLLEELSNDLQAAEDEEAKKRIREDWVKKHVFDVKESGE